MTRFKRPACLVAYWEGEELRVRDCATGKTSPVLPAEVALLTALTRWRSLAEIAHDFAEAGRRELRAAVRGLLSRGLVISSDRPQVEAERQLSAWRDWSPEATLFHFGTKDLEYMDWREEGAEMERVMAWSPPPSPLKQVRGRQIELPAYPRRGMLPSVLLSRRSWRRFGRQTVTLDQVSTLLGLTWGVQKWAHVGRGIRFALKTSPSGGGCHSIEVYLAVRQVHGLHPGLYHYCPDSHALTLLNKPWTFGRMTRALGGQPWFAHASATAFMTSVFPRVQWKYRAPRTYRVVLLEAGHFCQTFCLVATWLGLAPFCTAALADTLIERDLGIDGVNESVLYAAGVGPRPGAVSWAPWWDRKDVPRTTLPLHRMRRTGARRSAT